MPDTLDEVHERVFERALGMTDARLVSMLLVVNKHARQLACEVADECYGGDVRGVPNTLQTEAALLEVALARFAPEAFEDGFALYAEEFDA